LNGLAERLAIQIEAVYRWARMPSHPWGRLPVRKFKWRVSAHPGGRDKELEAVAANRSDALIVFIGWRNRTMFPPLLKRVCHRLPYAFWTDTPKVGRGILRRVINASYCFFARHAVTTLATGNPAVERYRGMGLPPHKIDSFPFVVDPDHFSPPGADQRSWDDLCSRFILCGRLSAKLKGQSVAIAALAEATKKSQMPLELILAGAGPDEGVLREQALRMGVEKSVRFAGWVEYDQLPFELRRCGALVMPSFWDPYPVAVLEAMAAGLPILGSRACGSVRERVIHGENGFIHDPGDAVALSEHMSRIASDPGGAQSMGLRSLAVSRAWGIDAATEVVRRVIQKAGSH